jgi:hypothetical protein
MDGISCTDCHFPGPLLTVEDWIMTNIPATGYVPGQKYTITASGIHNGANKFGFQITAEDKNGKSGTFVITDATNTQFSPTGEAWVTHTAAGTTATGGTASWSMDWIAPASGSGIVTFYATFNAANGDGSNNGDVIYGSAKSFSQSTVGIDENELASQVSIYPNPATNFINVDLPVSAQVRIFDLTGKLILDVEGVNGITTVDLNEFEPGLYITQIESDGSNIARRFVVR